MTLACCYDDGAVHKIVIRQQVLAGFLITITFLNTDFVRQFMRCIISKNEMNDVPPVGPKPFNLSPSRKWFVTFPICSLDLIFC